MKHIFVKHNGYLVNAEFLHLFGAEFLYKAYRLIKRLKNTKPAGETGM
jgi:hypothetical protein